MIANHGHRVRRTLSRKNTILVIIVVLHICFFGKNNGLTGRGTDPRIQLMSNSQQNVMVGQQLIITCATTESASMAWSSEEYIGIGGVQLEYDIMNDAVGGIQVSGVTPTTFANLTMVNPSAFELESQLHMTVLDNITPFTVTCHNSGNGISKNITFLLATESTSQANTDFTTMAMNTTEDNVSTMGDGLSLRNRIILGSCIAVIVVIIVIVLAIIGGIYCCHRMNRKFNRPAVNLHESL